MPTKFKPFCYGLPQHREGVPEDNSNKSFFSGKERRHSILKHNTIMSTKTVMNADMVNINQETLFNKVKFPYVVSVEDLKHIYPYIKSLFCARKIPTFLGSWKVKKLYRELAKSDKRHRNSAVSGGLYNTISRNSSTEKHPRLSQLKSDRKDSSTKGNSKHVE